MLYSGNFAFCFARFEKKSTFAIKSAPIVSLPKTGLNRESCENQEQYPLLLALYFFLNSILSHCFFENGKAFKKRASQKTCRFYT